MQVVHIIYMALFVYYFLFLQPYTKVFMKTFSLICHGLFCLVSGLCFRFYFHHNPYERSIFISQMVVLPYGKSLMNQTYLTICNIFQIWRQITLVLKGPFGSIATQEDHFILMSEQSPGITSRFPLTPLFGSHTMFYVSEEPRIRRETDSLHSQECSLAFLSHPSCNVSMPGA